MPTLILSARNSEDNQRLWQAAIRRGWDVERLHGWRVSESLKSVTDPVLYAEALLAPIHAAELGLSLREMPDDWLVRLPEEYRKRSVQLMTLHVARSQPFPHFLKPPNDKSFRATICYSSDDFPQEYDETLPVLVAEIVHWEKEFRCFVLNRELKTWSVYLRSGELQRECEFQSSAVEAAEVVEFIGRLLADPRIDFERAMVIDVGVIQGRGWSVVEANAAWGSGLYGCDPDAVLDVLIHAANPLPRQFR